MPFCLNDAIGVCVLLRQQKQKSITVLKIGGLDLFGEGIVSGGLSIIYTRHLLLNISFSACPGAKPKYSLRCILMPLLEMGKAWCKYPKHPEKYAHCRCFAAVKHQMKFNLYIKMQLFLWENIWKCSLHIVAVVLINIRKIWALAASRIPMPNLHRDIKEGYIK